MVESKLHRVLYSVLYYVGTYIEYILLGWMSEMKTHEREQLQRQLQREYNSRYVVAKYKLERTSHGTQPTLANESSCIATSCLSTYICVYIHIWVCSVVSGDATTPPTNAPFNSYSPSHDFSFSCALLSPLRLTSTVRANPQATTISYY